MRLTCSSRYPGTYIKNGRFQDSSKYRLRRRGYATTPKPSGLIENVAILGGGITGLATTFFLSKALPKTKITLYEAGSQLGGWIHTRHVDTSNGQVVFEQGPRTLRPGFPDGWVTVDLVSARCLNEIGILTGLGRSTNSNWRIKY